jgi:hypothetical protein
MDSTAVETGEHHTIALEGSSQQHNIEWPEKVDSDVGKWRKMGFDSTGGEWTHQRRLWLTLTLLACETIPDDSIDGSPRVEYMVLSTESMKGRI